MGGGWKSWGPSAWNETLFRHYFVATEAEPGPVTRLTVTPEELVVAVGEADAGPSAVRAAFLDVLRDSPSSLRQKLSPKAWLNVNDEWANSTTPRFFVYLVLTCLVASSVKHGVLRANDFRERLNSLLQYPLHTQHNIPGLAVLWRAFHDWLSRRRAIGAPFRDLRLPDPGKMTQIGYSVRLAFPARQDQRRLIDLVSKDNIEAEEPAQISRLVGRNVGDFSDGFRDSFAEFERALSRGELDLDSYPFWSAARAALRVALAADLEGNPTRLKYQLILDTNDEFYAELCLLVDAPFSPPPGISLVPVEGSVGAFSHIVSSEKGATTDLHGELLSSGALALPDFTRSSICTAVRQSLLLFKRNDLGLSELLPRRGRDEGDRWGLIRSDLVDELRGALPTKTMPNVRSSQYAGWVELGPFHASVLEQMHFEPLGRLSQLHCLRSPYSGARLTLRDGIALGGEYLGLPDCLPTISVQGADEVVLYELRDGMPAEDVAAHGSRIDDDNYALVPTKGRILDGRFNMVARKGGFAVAQRQVAFRGVVHWVEYRAPKRSDGLITEAGGPDVVWVPDGQPLPLGARAAPSTHGKLKITKAAAVASRPHGLPLVGDDAHDTRDSAAVHRFVEICAAIASRRRGIHEAELLDWIRQCFGIHDPRMLWDVLRSWVEAGCFDRTLQTRWRGRLYFARSPALMKWRVDSRWGLTLCGLAPRIVEAHVSAIARRIGLSPCPRTGSHHGPVLSTWVADEPEAIEELERQTRLPLVSLPALVEAQWSFAAIVDRWVPAPLSHEDQAHWNWRNERFEQRVDTSQQVQIALRRRSDGPDYYLVTDEDRSWWSYSRNWALLIAMVANGLQPFAIDGNRLLARGAARAPLAIGRYTSVVSDVSPGPLATGRGTEYRYTFRTLTEPREVIDLLWGRTERRLVNRVRSLLSLARSPSLVHQPHVSLPLSLRKQLSRHDPTVATLLHAARVPVGLLPHFRGLRMTKGGE